MSLLRRRSILPVTAGGVPTEGLIGEWLFSGNANDTSGSGLDLTVDGAVLTSGRKGQPNTAYYFDGVNDRLHRPDSAVMSGDTHTLSVWVNYQDANPSGLERVVMSRRSTGGGFTYKERGAGINSFTVGYIPSAVDYGGLTLSPLTWYHYCFAYNELTAEVEMYINGVSQGVKSINYNGGLTASIAIGCNNIATNRFWHGKIDDVRFYNRVLSNDEVQSLYNE